MNEDMLKFVEEVKNNEELKAKLIAITDRETAVTQKIEIAKEYGFNLTEEDFKLPDKGELSADDLDQVTGGCIVYKDFSFIDVASLGAVLGVADLKSLGMGFALAGVETLGGKSQPSAEAESLGRQPLSDSTKSERLIGRANNGLFMA